MKKNFILATALVAGLAFTANLPAQIVIDGTIDPGEGWTSVGEATDGEFWQTFEADELFFAEDETYLYFAATRNHGDDWQMFGFIVDEETAGGATNNPWGRSFTYAHSNLPDLIMHGNWDGGYAEIWTWDGAALVRLDEDLAGDPESNRVAFGDVAVSGDNQTVEVRIAKALLPNLDENVNVQYYTSGNNNDHGIFDSIPNDDVADTWDGPNNVLENYVNVALASGPSGPENPSTETVSVGTDVEVTFELTAEISVTVTFDEVTAAGDLTIEWAAGDGDAASLGFSVNRLAGQTYTITADGSLEFDAATIVFDIDDSLLGSELSDIEAITRAYVVNGTDVDEVEVTGDNGDGTVTASDVSSFSTWYFGDTVASVNDWMTLE